MRPALSLRPMSAKHHPISEAELADNAKNGAVKTMQFVRTPDGGYKVICTLTWKSGNYVLTTTRGKPREWASLDRLARHIHETFPEAPPITLVLDSQNAP